MRRKNRRSKFRDSEHSKAISKDIGEATLPRKREREISGEIRGEVTLPRKGEKDISGEIGEVTLPRKREGRSLSNANSSSWPVVGSLVSRTRAQTHLRLWFQELGIDLK